MVQKLIKKIEPGAFVKVLPVVNVWGRGRRFIDINAED
jgi:uncharacterized membrane-anchored protein YitT (DUF2179 family)